jgi:hypothetical protein
MSDLDQAIKTLGDSINDIVTKAITVKDIRIAKTASLEFFADPEKQIYGKGLFWKGMGNTKQFVYKANPDRIYSSESIDLAQGQGYSVGNTTVINENELGPTVIHSHLTRTGTLQNLATQGNLNIDDYIFYNSGYNRFGIGTEDPNGALSVTSLDAEFIVDAEGSSVKVGTYTTDDLSFITDDTKRLTITKTGQIVLGTKGSLDTKVSIHGRLGIGVNNIDNEVSLSTAGPIKIEGKKFTVESQIPTEGTYSKGDIVWNTDPKPTGYVGWICVRDGTPGEWKPFGQISS